MTVYKKAKYFISSNSHNSKPGKLAGSQIFLSYEEDVFYHLIWKMPHV